MELTKQNIEKAMGKNIPKDIWSSKLKKYFKFVNIEQIDEEIDELQSFQNFLEMEIEPNVSGTGRNRLKNSDKTITFVFIGDVPTRKIKIKELIELFQAFFQLEVIIIDPLELKKNKKSISLIDRKNKLVFPLKTNKKMQIDVFSLFDILIEYKKNSFSIVGFIDNEIFDPEFKKNFQVYGRACGDGVAVITTSLENKKEIYTTALHETCHNFGIDHCVLFNCLMNAVIDQEENLVLCPVDLRKLYSEIKFDVRNRYLELLKIVKKLNWKPEIKWLENICKII